jgi:hypothetical protein
MNRSGEVGVFEVVNRLSPLGYGQRSGIEEIVLVLRAQPGTRTPTRNEAGHRADNAGVTFFL